MRLLAPVAALLAVLVAASPAMASTPAVVVRSGLRDLPEVALTFDDCYSASRGEAIRLTLLQYGVPATLFCTATKVRDYPDLMRRFLADGHEFGNHTRNHRNLTKLSETDIRTQICRARAIIDRTLGVPSTNLFRPPYGAFNATVKRIAGECGYTHLVTWDIDTRDWASGMTSDDVVARALTGTNGSIILLHIGPAPTPGAIARIVEDYLARGFRFVKASDLIARLGETA